MKKFDKVLNWILFGLFATCLVASIVCYLVNPAMTQSFFNYVLDLLNRPLPIIGVTTLAILVFIWKVIIATNYGKAKLAKYDQKQKELEEQYKEFVEKCESKLNELEQNTNLTKEQLTKLCGLSTNKKIKDFGKELANGKELDSETKAD